MGPRCTPDGDELVCADGQHRYRVVDGIPLFAEQFCSPEGLSQQAHYEKIAAAYVANLNYPHTEEYLAYLDRALLEAIGDRPLGTVAELCCGRGEAFQLLGARISRGVGVDVSPSMLRAAAALHDADQLFLCAGRRDDAAAGGGERRYRVHARRHPPHQRPAAPLRRGGTHPEAGRAVLFPRAGQRLSAVARDPQP